jgi:hypothetical protein
MVPADLYESVRDGAHRAQRSRSEVGSVAIARGLGLSPGWLRALAPGEPGTPPGVTSSA